MAGIIRSLKVAALRVVSRRKRRLIHAGFQSKVILFGVSIGLASLAVTFAATKIFFWQCERVLIQAGFPFDNPIYGFVQQQENYLTFIFFVAAAVSLGIAGWVGLTLSHRVAGPLYRMRRHLLEAAGGRAPKLLKFREKDFFHELAEAYNAELVTRGRVRRPGSEPVRRRAA